MSKVKMAHANLFEGSWSQWCRGCGARPGLEPSAGQGFGLGPPDTAGAGNFTGTW